MAHNCLKVRSLFLVAALAILCCANVQDSGAAGQDKVMAKIGDQTVTEQDLKEMVKSFPDKSYQTPEGEKQALDYLVNIYVLAAEAQAQGMDKEPEVQRYLKFSQKDLLARMFLDKLTKNSPTPTDKDAKDYYEANKAQFAIPESIHLHHVLVKTEKEAKDAMARLKKGDKFADIATEVSTCPSRVKGGDLDWLPRGTMVQELEDVAFSMTPGQTAGPVKSKFGFHVLFLEEKRPAQDSALDQVMPQIIEQLKFKAQQDQYEKLAQDLRTKMKVQVNYPQETEAADKPAPSGPTTTPKK